MAYRSSGSSAYLKGTVMERFRGEGVVGGATAAEDEQCVAGIHTEVGVGGDGGGVEETARRRGVVGGGVGAAESEARETSGIRGIDGVGDVLAEDGVGEDMVGGGGTTRGRGG